MLNISAIINSIGPPSRYNKLTNKPAAKPIAAPAAFDWVRFLTGSAVNAATMPGITRRIPAPPPPPELDPILTMTEEQPLRIPNSVCSQEETESREHFSGTAKGQATSI